MEKVEKVIKRLVITESNCSFAAVGKTSVRERRVLKYEAEVVWYFVFVCRNTAVCSWFGVIGYCWVVRLFYYDFGFYFIECAGNCAAFHSAQKTQIGLVGLLTFFEVNKVNIHSHLHGSFECLLCSACLSGTDADQ